MSTSQAVHCNSQVVTGACKALSMACKNSCCTNEPGWNIMTCLAEMTEYISKWTHLHPRIQWKSFCLNWLFQMWPSHRSGASRHRSRRKTKPSATRQHPHRAQFQASSLRDRQQWTVSEQFDSTQRDLQNRMYCYYKNEQGWLWHMPSRLRGSLTMVTIIVLDLNVHMLITCGILTSRGKNC